MKHTHDYPSVQDPSPTLDRTGGSYKYSKAFQEIIEQCLEKDPEKRSTAAELLTFPFFRNAKKKSYLVGTVLSEDLLSPLKTRSRLPITDQSYPEALPPLAERQERRKRDSSSFHNTLDSWDFSSTLSLSAKRSLSTSRRSSLHPDSASHTTDPVFELDEDQVIEKRQLQEDNEKSEESSSGPPTPAPATPVLVGVSSPPKDQVANQALSVSPDERKPGLNYNPPTTAPIPTRVTHIRSTSRSAPGTPTDSNDTPVADPHSAPSEKTSHGSKLWNKLTKPGSNRGKKLNAALDKTGTIVRVMSAGFSSKSPKG